MMGRRVYQRDLFDISEGIAPKIDPESIYALLHHLGPHLLRDEDYSAMYARSQGRPSIPPALLAGLLLLQRHADVSDREATERLQFDLRWQYALHLPVHVRGIAHTNLCHFRSRLIVHGLEGHLFERFNELAVEAGLLDPAAPQAIDSSHLFGAAAVKDTYDLLRGSLRKLLATLLEEEPAAAEALIRTYGLEARLEPEKPDIDWADAEARLAWLREIVREARGVLAALDGHSLASSETVQEAATLLSDILAQDITAPEEEPDEGPEIKQGTATGRILSVVDPEMRHGRKSASRRFDGYKVHISESLESELITGVLVTAGNAYDGEHAADLFEEVKRQLGRLPAVVLGDSHYGSCDVRVALEALTDEEGERVEVIAKLPPTPSRKRFSKDDFEIDLEQGQVTCPAGEVTQRSSQRSDRKDRKVPVYRFDAKTCGACALRDQCTSSKRGRTITLHYHEDLRQHVRAYNETDAFKQRYRRRALVERKLAELLWLRGLRQSRYLGRKKTELQAVWTATVVNIKRAGAALMAYLAGETRPCARAA